MIHQKIYIPIIVFLILCTGVIYYLPVMKKGYPPQMSSGDLILARNLLRSGLSSLENDRGVILSSANVNQNSLPSDAGNRLTALIYAKLFSIFGVNINLPIYASIIAYVLVNLLFFFLIYLRLGLKEALLFSAVYAFLPAVWDGALFPGFYEFGLLFFSAGLFVYFFREKSAWWQMLMAGLFFGLSAAARNAFAISFVGLFIFDFWQNKSLKRLIILGLPCLLVFLAFMGANNIYTQKGGSESYGQYAHAFPDPYTFIFERDSFAQNAVDSAQGDVGQYLADYGYALGFKQQVSAFINSLKFYLRELVNLINYGGPLMLMLAMVGWWQLKKRLPELVKFCTIWLTVLFVILIALRTSNWDHLLEILFPIVLLISLGVGWLFEQISGLGLTINKKRIMTAVLFLAIIGHLIIADKWMFHEEYATGNMELIASQVKLIEAADITPADVIAYGGHPAAVHQLNWLTDKNIVKFAPETVEKLIANNKLQNAFQYFGVTAISGFNDQLRNKIVATVKVKDLVTEVK